MDLMFENNSRVNAVKAKVDPANVFTRSVIPALNEGVKTMS
jgi:hypothetical protein